MKYSQLKNRDRETLEETGIQNCDTGYSFLYFERCGCQRSYNFNSYKYGGAKSNC